jgi:hypothetical protein
MILKMDCVTGELRWITIGKRNMIAARLGDWTFVLVSTFLIEEMAHE